MEEKETIQTLLNIGAGKIYPLFLSRLHLYFLVNLDIMYEESRTNEILEIEKRQKEWELFPNKNIEIFSNKKWEEFFPLYRLQFDKVVIYRFLEHIRMTKVLFFIYLLSTVVKVGGSVDIIVPNYNKLAELILAEDPSERNFEANNILITTELLNEPEDPHASIWTPKRAKYFFELEGRFNIENITETFKFDGRDIYMQFNVRRV